MDAMRDMGWRVARWVGIGVLVLQVACGAPGAGGNGTGTGETSEAGTDTTAPAGRTFSVDVIASVFAGLGANANAAIGKSAAPAGAEVCTSATVTYPAGVTVGRNGPAGTYGAAGDQITVTDADFCDDQTGADNTGTGPNGDGLFAVFSIETLTAACTSGGTTSNVYLRSGQGLFRNTGTYFPEVYGIFSVAGSAVDCTLRLLDDGSVATAVCTDSGGNALVSSSSATCTLTVGVVAPTVTAYRGIWAPALLQGFQSMADPDDLLADGVTIMSVVAGGLIDPSGNVTREDSDATLGDVILDYYDYGIGVMLSYDTMYTTDGTRAGQTGPEVPVAVAGDATFQNNLTTVTAALAELAQTYDVEIFAPLNEADLKLTATHASTWGQDAYATLRAAYTGKLLWKTGLTTNGIVLTNYDVVGISSSPGIGESDATYRARIQTNVVDMLNNAATYGVTETLVSEFGVWGDADGLMTEAEIAAAYTAVFEESATSVDGYFAFDGPSVAGDPPLLGSDAEDVVRDWYLNRL